MKKQLLALAVFSLVALPAKVSAETVRECSTDSYGNTTCRDKTTNVETGVITYSNVSSSSSGGSSSSGTSGTSSSGQMQILNTATPSSVNLLAAAIVALGGVAFVSKRFLRRLS